MNEMFGFVRRGLLSVLLMLAAALGASATFASPLVLPIAGTGEVTPGPGFDPNLPVWPLQVLPGASNVYTLAGQPGWSLTSDFTFSFITNTGTGSFQMRNAFGDSLFGSIATVLDPTNGPFGGFDITYTVTGGTGSFVGFVGSGLSEVVLLAPPGNFPLPFSESGTIFQSAVSEPPALALALLGLVGLVAARRRKR
jgi:MYXO-CTERM domain-containing protein